MIECSRTTYRRASCYHLLLVSATGSIFVQVFFRSFIPFSTPHSYSFRIFIFSYVDLSVDFSCKFDYISSFQLPGFGKNLLCLLRKMIRDVYPVKTFFLRFSDKLCFLHSIVQSDDYWGFVFCILPCMDSMDCLDIKRFNICVQLFRQIS